MRIAHHDACQDGTSHARRERSGTLATILSLSLLISSQSFGQADSGPSPIFPRMERDFSGIIWGSGAPREEFHHAAGSPQTGAPASDPQKRPPIASKVERFPAALVAALQPWAYQALQKYHGVIASGEEPTTPKNNCYPTGVPGEHSAMGTLAFQFLIASDVILIAMEFNRHARIIHMNKEHPKDLQPSWLGHSVGRWEGDTLVVDTIGYNDLSQIATGFLHSPRLHTIERYRLADLGTRLEARYWFEDSGALTKPFEFVRVYSPAPNQQQAINEYVCHENNDRPVPLATAKTESLG